MQKLNRTTGDRAQDEDWRRIYRRTDELETALSVLQGTSTASTTPNTSPIALLPSIAPGGPPLPVAVTAASGVSTAYSPSDHVHAGSKQVYIDASVPAGNTIANTASEVAFASSYTIPANVLAVGMSLRLKLYLLYNTVGASVTVQLKVKVGGQTVLDTGLVTLVGVMTNGGMAVDGDLFVTAIGVSGSVEAQGVAQMGAPLSGSSLNITNTAPYVVNTTTTEAVTVTWQFGTAATGDNVTLRAMRIEVLQ